MARATGKDPCCDEQRREDAPVHSMWALPFEPEDSRYGKYRLVKRVTTVSVKTMAIVKALPPLQEGA